MKSMLFWIKLICLLVILVAVMTYSKWSYKEFDKRSKINSKHPNWTPYCGINFLKEDPEWFINHGYGDYVKEYVKG